MYYLISLKTGEVYHYSYDRDEIYNFYYFFRKDLYDSRLYDSIYNLYIYDEVNNVLFK